MQEVDVTLNPDGSFRIEPKGHKGIGCIEELKNILKELADAGIETEIKNQKLKPEFHDAYQRSTVSTQRR